MSKQPTTSAASDAATAQALQAIIEELEQARACSRHPVQSKALREAMPPEEGEDEVLIECPPAFSRQRFQSEALQDAMQNAFLAALKCGAFKDQNPKWVGLYIRRGNPNDLQVSHLLNYAKVKGYVDWLWDSDIKGPYPYKGVFDEAAAQLIELLRQEAAALRRAEELAKESVRISGEGDIRRNVASASERRFMELALAEARKCSPEDERPHPKVGAVVVKDGKILGVAHRGELAPGDHAEYTVLEKKLADATLAGATVYTTLEPCTTRKHPKVPCADRLAERRVARVVVGMLDPNPNILGTGIRRLREARIGCGVFDDDLTEQVEELNRDFIRAHKRTTPMAATAGATAGAVENFNKALMPTTATPPVADGTRLIDHAAKSGLVIMVGNAITACVDPQRADPSQIGQIAPVIASFNRPPLQPAAPPVPPAAAGSESRLYEVLSTVTAQRSAILAAIRDYANAERRQVAGGGSTTAGAPPYDSALHTAQELLKDYMRDLPALTVERVCNDLGCISLDALERVLWKLTDKKTLPAPGAAAPSPNGSSADAKVERDAGQPGTTTAPGAQKEQHAPPESVRQAVFWQVWRWPRWLKSPAIIIALLVGAAFVIWTSLPDATKQKVVDWIAKQF